MRRLAGCAALAATAALLCSGCESRETPRAPGGIERDAVVRQSELQPGQPVAARPMTNVFAGDAHALAEGKRLYNWYNCSGCHFSGGGGIGPPLMDDDWIYGSEPQNILASVLEGRPNGMPSYRGKLPQDHALKIVAYVSSLSADVQVKPELADGGKEDTAGERTPALERADEEAEEEGRKEREDASPQ